MYKSFYGLEITPFEKSEKPEYCYKSSDYSNVICRLNYLKEIKGIGLIIGSPGIGKSYTIRCFIENLNEDLNKVIYISSTNLSSFEFYGSIAKKLSISVGSCYKDELYSNIQAEIKRLVDKQRKEVMVIIDDAGNLSREIFTDLKILYDFGMERKDYTTIILVGDEKLFGEISKGIYETLQQRIVVNYKYHGLKREEVKNYIDTRMKLSKQENEIFTADAINALYGASKGNPRRLNNLVINSLIIGSQQNKKEIDSEIVRLAKEEIDFIKWEESN